MTLDDIFTVTNFKVMKAKKKSFQSQEMQRFVAGPKIFNLQKTKLFAIIGKRERVGPAIHLEKKIILF